MDFVVSYCRHGTNGTINGAPKEHAGTFLGGLLVSVILPIAGIVYFVFFQEHVSILATDASSSLDSQEAIMLDQVVDALAKEL